MFIVTLSLMTVSREKIVQIIPADNWVTTYQDSEIKEDVVCFALVEVTTEWETYQEVRAMVQMDLKRIGFNDDCVNFIGIEKKGNGIQLETDDGQECNTKIK